MKNLDALIAAADPTKERADNTDLIISELWHEVEALEGQRSRGRWWRSPKFVAPAAAVLVAGLTAAAVVAPMQLFVNGQAVELDVTIPIVYTTETGVTISCDYGIYVGDPATRSAADDELAAFLAAEDWTGVGQEIYDEAMANPFVPGPDDVWETDTQEMRDQFSFNRATWIIYERFPEGLWSEGMSTGGSSTCTGRLR